MARPKGSRNRWFFEYTTTSGVITICAGGKRSACNQVLVALGPKSTLSLDDISRTIRRTGERPRTVRVPKAPEPPLDPSRLRSISPLRPETDEEIVERVLGKKRWRHHRS